jgi:hypothetical protein
MKDSTRKQVYALLRKAGLTEQKDALIYSYSGGTTTSTTEMKEYQAIDLVKYLRAEVAKIEGEKEKANKMRRLIISVWYKIEDAKIEEQKKRAVEHCKDWVLKMFKRDLNAFSAQELFRIKMAAENVLRDEAKAIRKALL